MDFRKIAAVVLGVLLLAAPCQADTLTQMSGNCGDLPTSPVYSKADYASVLADAAKASAAAKKAGKTKLANEIGFKVNRIKQCQKLDLARYAVPPYKDCKTFIADARSFLAWAAAASRDKLATGPQIQRIRQGFQPLAEKCARATMETCVDPLDTKAVLAAVEAIETAGTFTPIGSLAGKTGLERAGLEYNPFTTTLTFCAETDYACKGSPATCSDRVPRIKSAFQSWIGD
jgi:hypothetical protein